MFSNKKWRRLAVLAVLALLLGVGALLLAPSQSVQDGAAGPAPAPAATAALPHRTAKTPRAAGSAATFTSPYDAAPDAWEIALAAEKSGDLVLLHQSNALVIECLGVLKSQDDIQNFIAGGNSRLDQPVQRVERRAAAERVLKACLPFLQRGRPATQQLLFRLTDAERRLAQDFPSSPELSWKEHVAQTLLRDAGEPAHELGLLLLEDVSASEIAEGDFAIYLSASRSVACELGADCSAEGPAMSRLCLYSSVCGVGQKEFFTRELEAGDLQKFEAYQAQLRLLAQGKITVADFRRFLRTGRS